MRIQLPMRTVWVDYGLQPRVEVGRREERKWEGGYPVTVRNPLWLNAHAFGSRSREKASRTFMVAGRHA